MKMTFGDFTNERNAFMQLRENRFPVAIPLPEPEVMKHASVRREIVR